MAVNRRGREETKSVLLAEDDANLRRGIADLLSMEGFTCFAASDGEVALTLLRARAPHIAIIDVMMPKLDGLTVCRRIREQDPVLPILILSARDSEIDRVVGLEYGADDYLSKPFGPRELLARIRSLLRRAALCRTQPPADTRFTLGDIEVVTGELRAYRGANRFDLTARDVMLLKVLYDRKGRVVSRDDLFDLCWGRDHMPNSRALDQYVSALRKKIEIDPSNPQIIKTVHGFGYRFDV